MWQSRKGCSGGCGRTGGMRWYFEKMNKKEMTDDFQELSVFFLCIFLKMERKAHRDSAIGRMEKKLMYDRLE